MCTPAGKKEATTSKIVMKGEKTRTTTTTVT
jgi:hypothetical protein